MEKSSIIVTVEDQNELYLAEPNPPKTEGLTLSEGTRDQEEAPGSSPDLIPDDQDDGKSSEEKKSKGKEKTDKKEKRLSLKTCADYKAVLDDYVHRAEQGLLNENEKLPQASTAKAARPKDGITLHQLFIEFSRVQIIDIYKNMLALEKKYETNALIYYANGYAFDRNQLSAIVEFMGLEEEKSEASDNNIPLVKSWSDNGESGITQGKTRVEEKDDTEKIIIEFDPSAKEPEGREDLRVSNMDSALKRQLDEYLNAGNNRNERRSIFNAIIAWTLDKFRSAEEKGMFELARAEKRQILTPHRDNEKKNKPRKK